MVKGKKKSQDLRTKCKMRGGGLEGSQWKVVGGLLERERHERERAKERRFWDQGKL